MTIWVWWHDETNLPCSVAPALKVGLISPPDGPYGCHKHGRWRKFQEVEEPAQEQPQPAQASEGCPHCNRAKSDHDGRLCAHRDKP